jgi:Ssp1 endopeptidase immunity protein Rap1a
MKTLIAAVVIFIMFITLHKPAQAGSFKTDVWVNWCTKKDGTPEKIACTFYVLGLYDGLILWHANSEDPIKLCVPEHKNFISAKQLVDIGLEYIRKHQDSYPRPIGVVLREAFEEAFPEPCKEM